MPIEPPKLLLGGGCIYFDNAAVRTGDIIFGNPNTGLSFTGISFVQSGELSVEHSGFYLMDLHLDTTNMSGGVSVEIDSPSGNPYIRISIATPSANGDLSHSRVDYLDIGDSYKIKSRANGTILDGWLTLVCLGIGKREK